MPAADPAATKPMARSGSGTVTLPAPWSVERWLATPWPLVLIVLLGAANFFWQLGSSSYFVDEVFSIEAASHSLGGVISAVQLTEFTPPTYYLFLHEWIGRIGSQAEWLLRLPSALAGVALVAAVYWMARAFLDRRGALTAAALCALSPAVLQYAQEVRAYAFAMLAVTLAVGAAIRGVGTEATRRRMRSLGALAAVIGLLMHYTATLVILPLCVWLGTRGAVSRRARAAFVGSCALAEVLIAPLFLHTYRYVPNGAAGKVAALTWTNLAQVAATPFVARGASGVGALTVIAGAATLVSILLLLPAVARRIQGGAPVHERRLLVALAAFAPVMLLVGALAGKNVLLPRYSAVAAPFLITAVAAAVRSLPRPAAAALALAALVPACAGVIVSHSRSGFYPPTRDAIDYIGAHRQPRELIALSGSVVIDPPLGYYAATLLHPTPKIIGNSDPLMRATRNHSAVWLVGWLPGDSYNTQSLIRSATLVLGRVGYRVERLQTFATADTLELVLARRGRVTR